MLLTTKLDKSTRRIRLVALGFTLVYCVIGGKLVYFAMHPELRQTHEAASDTVAAARPDILDRNGDVLATDIKVMSVFAEPRRIIDKDEAIEQLTAVLPDVDPRIARAARARTRASSGSSAPSRRRSSRLSITLACRASAFCRRTSASIPTAPSPRMCSAMPISTASASPASKNISTGRASALHSAGFNLTPPNLKPIVTSLDLDATYAVRDELAKGIAKFKAKAGAAAIINVNTGEVIAMASLPDFDPNNPVDALDPQQHQSPDGRRL